MLKTNKNVEYCGRRLFQMVTLKSGDGKVGYLLSYNIVVYRLRK